MSESLLYFLILVIHLRIHTGEKSNQCHVFHKDLIELVPLRHIWKPSLVKNHKHVMCVRRSVLLHHSCQHIATSTLVKRHMSAIYVRKDLVSLDNCRYI